jgi:serine protease Do
MRKPASVWSAGLAAALLVLGWTGPLVGPAAAQSEGTAWLGVYTQSISSGLRDGMDYEGDGILVSRVVDGSPADRAGVRKGDVLISVSGDRVSSPGELSRIVRDHRVGESVNLSIWRDGSRRTIAVRLGARPGSGDDPGFEGEIETPAPPAPPRAPRAPRFGDDDDESPRARRTPRLEAFERDAFDRAFRMRRGRLGIQIQDLTEDMSEALDVPGGKGVLVVEVMDDTPAKRAGLRAGDVIVRLDDRDVDESSDLTQALDDARDDRVSITLVRRGARRTVEAEIDRSGTRAWSFGDNGDRKVEIHRLGPNSDDRALREELRALREELRVLREKIERLER